MAKVAHLVDPTTLALYRFAGAGTEGEIDRTGHGFNLGHVYGSTLDRVTGKFGPARRFLGDVGGSGWLYTELTYNPFVWDPFVLVQSLTVESMIRVPWTSYTQNELDFPVVWSIAGYSVDGFWATFLQLRVDPEGHLAVGYSWGGGGSDFNEFVTDYSIPSDEWVHVAVRSFGNLADDQTVTVSVNGVEVASFANRETPNLPEDLVQLGLYVGNYYVEQFTYRGDLEELVLRVDVRSDAQLAADAEGHDLGGGSEAPDYTPPGQLGVARDFLLDLSTCEIVLGPDGDWVLARDLDAIKQDAHTALGFIRGEWYLDDAFGFGLRDTVLVKSPNVDLIRAEVRRVLLTVVGIVSVTSVEVTLDKAARLAVVKWSAATDVGELLNQTTRIQA